MYFNQNKYDNRLNVEAETAMQLSSIKLYIKDIYTSVNQCHLSHQIVLEHGVIFH